MVELGSFPRWRMRRCRRASTRKAIKTWYSDDAEIEKIFKPWTDDWNKATIMQ